MFKIGKAMEREGRYEELEEERSGEKLLNGRGVLLWNDINVLEWEVIAQIVNEPNATELLALTWLISCYVNFISINYLF